MGERKIPQERDAIKDSVRGCMVYGLAGWWSLLTSLEDNNSIPMFF